MCTDNINTDQFKTNLEQIDEAIALNRRWLHRAFHQLEDSNRLKTAAKLRDAQALLDDVRALLDEAAASLEKESLSDAVSVRLV
jgi:hypothetical protein